MPCCDLGVVKEGMIHVYARFWNSLTQQLDSPTAVTFTVQDPSTDPPTDISTPDASITEVEEGVFRLDYQIPFGASSQGRWYIRARGTAGLIAEDEVTFVVPPSVLA